MNFYRQCPRPPFHCIHSFALVGTPDRMLFIIVRYFRVQNLDCANESGDRFSLSSNAASGQLRGLSLWINPSFVRVADDPPEAPRPFANDQALSIKRARHENLLNSHRGHTETRLEGKGAKKSRNRSVNLQSVVRLGRSQVHSCCPWPTGVSTPTAPAAP